MYSGNGTPRRVHVSKILITSLTTINVQIVWVIAKCELNTWLINGRVRFATLPNTWSRRYHDDMTIAYAITFVNVISPISSSISCVFQA